MDSFGTYLLWANAVAFVAYTLDFFLCHARPSVNDSAVNAVVMCLFPVAGGPVGSLAGLLLWSGLVRGHRISKDNVAWLFFSLVCLVVWGVATALVEGLVVVDLHTFLGAWDLGRLKVLGIYLAAINVVTLVLFVADKHVAANGNIASRRTPEVWLLGLCLAGGSVGGLVGMYAARHKTKKWYFTFGLPVFLVLDALLALLAHGAGWL